MKAKVNSTEIFFDIEGSRMAPPDHATVEGLACFVFHAVPGADHSYCRPWFSRLSYDMQLIYVDHFGSGHALQSFKVSNCLIEETCSSVPHVQVGNQ